MKSTKFLRAHLDDPNQLDWSREFRFCAQGNFAPDGGCEQRANGKMRCERSEQRDG
jgi:hypothetical protein